MRVYKPSEKVSAFGVVVMLLVAIAGGALLGWGMGMADSRIVTAADQNPSKMLYLLALLVAMLPTVGAALVMHAAVRLGKVRFPAAAMAGGAACALAVIVCAAINFWACGSTISWGWLAFGAGAIFTGIGAMPFAAIAARAPFCETCGTWFGNERRLKEYPYTVRPRLIALLQEANIPRPEQLISPPPDDMDCTLALAVSNCRCPKSKSMLLIKRIGRSVDRQGMRHTNTSLLVALAVSADEQAYLTTALTNPSAARPAGRGEGKPL